MKNEYDDPYSFLALHLISSSTVAGIQRLLEDDDLIYRMIIKEVRGQDFIGPFMDAIITELLDEKKRMEMCHELDKLALYFYNNLDIKRLRSKIIEYCDIYSIL